MKMKIFVFLIAAGLAVTGCSAGKEGQSGTDSLTTDSLGTMSDSTNTTTIPDTTRPDTVPRDTVPKP